MTIWIKLAFAVVTGAAGALLILQRQGGENQAMLEQSIKRELEGLRSHLFAR